jgi:hypothetical protein
MLTRARAQVNLGEGKECRADSEAYRRIAAGFGGIRLRVPALRAETAFRGMRLAPIPPYAPGSK